MGSVKLFKNRIVLITGASRGIGAAVAKRFAQEGAHVILIARTVSGLEKVDDEIQKAGGSATLVPLDLTEHDKIDQLAAQIAQRFGRLDILVGNAGVLGELTPLTHTESAIWQHIMDVNVTANWRLIRALDKLLKLSDTPRAMFVTSGVTAKATAYWGGYAVSKAAFEMLVKIYAAECATTNIKVNLIDPGAVRTAMRAHAMPGEDPMVLPSPEDITDVFVTLASPSCVKQGETVRA